MGVVVAIDAGTTSVRCLALDERGRVCGSAARELTQHYPRPGWVEHDPREIWEATAATLTELTRQVAEPIAAIGIANQRETTVVWDRRHGEPRAPAIVWQDRRTADRCRELRESGWLDQVRVTTGLVLDPYFSATKLEWLLRSGAVEADGHLAFGTVDSWLVWNLTGGEVHVTDPTNASRTMLFDIQTLQWDDALVDLFGVERSCLPQLAPTSGRLGTTRSPISGIPISALAGDQQAALFGQACFTAGMTKNTYGTGSFVLMHAGGQAPAPSDGALTTVAWQLGDGELAYALEAAIFVTGAAVQWLRDQLGFIERADELESLARQVDDAGDVYLVPAFTGLGSPWWDTDARGTIVGISRGTTRAHLARAVVDAMVFQTRDAIEAMGQATGRPVVELRIDGGASVMSLLLQLQADQLGVPVARPANQETTALGAAYLAGLAEGVWSSKEELQSLWQPDAVAYPRESRAEANRHHGRWRDAVSRSRDWIR